MKMKLVVAMVLLRSSVFELSAQEVVFDFENDN